MVAFDRCNISLLVETKRNGVEKRTPAAYVRYGAEHFALMYCVGVKRGE